MPEITPLRITIGQTATGTEHYFDRPHLTSKIRRSLGRGNNILISAPRRIGKSSLLNHLTAQQEEDEIIRYLSVQSASNSSDFFRALFKLLIKDPEIFQGIGSYYKNGSAAIKGLISRFRGISLEGGLQVAGYESVDYFNECLALLKDFKGKQVIILLDEFPDAVNNMIRQDKGYATNFLLQVRELRQMSHDVGLQFIYTGSTGLANVVQQLGAEDLINDLYEIKVPPYSEEEATAFIKSLVLGYQHYDGSSFQLDDTTVSHILSKITWRLPYYLQIIVESLHEHSEEDGVKPDNERVDQVLAEMICATSQYYRYFNYWHSRLEKNLSKTNQQAAVEILNQIATSNANSWEQIIGLTLPAEPTLNRKQILNILEHDGYISEDQRHYGFNSFLLQQWWLEHVAV